MEYLTRRRLLMGAAASILLPTETSAGWMIAQDSSTPPSQWRQLLIGDGGFMTGANVTNNSGVDQIVMRADSNPPWKWNPSATSPVGNNGATGAWQQLVTPVTMPQPLSENGMGYSLGSYEIMAAPSNPSVVYMSWFDFPNPLTNNAAPFAMIWKSTNGGATWVRQTSFPIATIAQTNADGTFSNYRSWGNKMAIHPSNPNIVYVGFMGTIGAYCTTDGSTWNAVTNLPTGTTAGGPGVIGWAFNPASPTTLYAWSEGHGVYISANANLGASSTWTRINSGVGPQDNIYRCDITPNGKYYVVDVTGTNAAGDLWSYNGSWTHEISTGNVVGVACDPSNSSHVVACGGPNTDSINENNGSGWSGYSAQSVYSFADVPWPSAAAFSTNIVGLAFSQVTAGKLYINGQNDFFTTTLSGAVTTGTVLTWHSMGTGQEELIGNVIICPTSGKPVFGGWDHPIFAPTDLTKYPTTFGPVADSTVTACWHMDSAKFVNTSFIAAIVDGNYAGGSGAQRSAFSTDGGQTWTLFTSSPQTLPTGVWNGTTGQNGGCMAVSTPTNFIWAALGQVPYVTQDGGKTWAAISIPGAPSFTGYLGSAQSCEVLVIADPNTQGVFWLYLSGSGFYKGTSNGTSWASVTATPPAGLLNIAIVPGQSSNYFMGNTAVAGGSGNAGQQQPGGAYPPNGGVLYFSSNGGVTWSQFNNINQWQAFGFGAAQSSFPSTYGVGWTLYQSATSLTINATGSYTFVLSGATAAALTPGTPISFQSNGVSGFATGAVVSFTNATNTLIVQIDYVSQSITASSWTVGAWGVWQLTAALTATPAWTQIGQWVNNSFAPVRSICGDPAIFGRVYFAYVNAGGAIYG